MFKRQRESIQI